MRRILPLIGLVLLAALLWWAETGDGTDPGSSGGTPHSQVTGTADSPAIPADLPSEVAETLRLVDADGPFPYDRDGLVFENREQRLPDRPRGYWREYTVPTPGSSDRGARRLVVGSGGEVYYTDDHYRSFRLIRSSTPGGGP